MFRDVAQWAARPGKNGEVVGSNPAVATKKYRKKEG